MSDLTITPRRTSASKPGVFYNLNAKGQRVYEFWYRDSAGVRRWETVGVVKLSEAVVARGDKQAKKQRGERLVKGDARFADVAAQWLATFEAKVARGEKSPRTLDLYRGHLKRNILPFFGKRRVAEISVYDVVAFYNQLSKRGLSGGTVRLAGVPLDLILADAAYARLIPSNPCREVRRDDRPRTGDRPDRIPTPAELTRILDTALPSYRPILEAAAYSGLRQSELLGLRWLDLDFEASLIRVRHQLDRKTRELAPPKSRASKRDVVLIAPLAAMLKRHRLASRYSAPEDFVFANRDGKGRNCRNIDERGFNAALTKAKISAEPRKLVFHDLRSYFASLLIFAGEDVVQVSKLLGHSSPGITLQRYSKLFDSANRAEKTRENVERQVAKLRVASHRDDKLWPGATNPCPGQAFSDRSENRRPVSNL
jgi:integrase